MTTSSYYTITIRVERDTRLSEPLQLWKVASVGAVTDAEATLTLRVDTDDAAQALQDILARMRTNAEILERVMRASGHQPAGADREGSQ